MRLRALAAAAAAACFALVVASSAWSASASTDANLHRDPKAPCYKWPAVDMDEDGVFDRVDNCVNTPKGCVVDRFGCEVDLDRDGVCGGIDQCPDTPAGEAVDEHGCSESQRRGNADRVAPRQLPPSPPPPTSEMERQLVEGGKIRLENLYFESGSANLLPESAAALDEAGSTLEKFPTLRFEVQGHTDTRGASRYNLRLSQARSEAVRAYLLAHFHLAPEQFTARGYGETEPETQERNAEELLRNRRVVLRVLNPGDLPKGVKVENKP